MTENFVFTREPDTLTIRAENRELMRWQPPEYCCELWTGDRWIDLERDLLQHIAPLLETKNPRRAAGA